MPGTTTNPAPVNTGAFNPLIDLDDDETPAPAVVAPVAVAAPTVAPHPTPVAAPTAETTPSPSVDAEGKDDDSAHPDADAEAESGDDAADDESGTEDHQVDRDTALAMYAKPPRRYTLAVIVLVIIAIWLIKPWTSLNVPETSSGPDVKSTTQKAKPAGDPVKDDMVTVHQKLTADGDLTDLKLPGAEVAAAGTSLYAARTIDGQCVIYGIIKGKDIEPQADSTAQACDPAVMKQVQEQLDAADAEQRTAAVDKVEAQLKSAADTAKFYASRNYDNGQPSLTGLTSDNLDDVTISSNHGDYAKLTAKSDDTCRTAIVAATGDLGEISTC